ncbi:hypothetical protein ABZY09_30530 [Streptomyces sp. NPDC002928]|uniref:hypothetical protein n=1 Tax=Streptomyces sp. NPDC002928 TaxID=3154440 RepID=UPI00339DC991
MADERSAPVFNVPEIKDQIGWRLLEQDKKDLRLLMADRRESSPTALLRALVEREAAVVRRRWTASAKRIAQEEEAADG